MHVSLDSALGRQRRLNSVGESVLQIAPSAAAAYSLRSLTGGDPKVVRVRRASDNHEQDFTASGVSSGALTSFVNAQVTPPLDIQELSATGRDGDFLIAKAAYSLRSLGTRQATLAATGDTVARANGKYVCQVRRSSDDAVKSFTADEVTDGTLLAFTNADYAKYTSDFSSGDDSWGSFDDVTETGNIDGIGGLDNNLRLAIGSATSGHRAYRSSTLPVGQKINFSARVFVPSTNSDVDGILIRDANGTVIVATTAPTQDEWVTVTANDVTPINAQLRVNLQKGAASSFTGNGSDVLYLRDITVTQVTSDGFVKTWYDQSITTQYSTGRVNEATGNHAVQATAANQPKIVNAGSLLTDGLTFDGSDDSMTTTSAISSTNIAIACVSKSANNATAGLFSMLDSFNDGHEALYLAGEIRIASNSSDLDVSATITNQNLYFANYDGSTQTLSSNGVASTQSTSQTISVSAVAQIGSRSGGNLLNGSIEEIIVYTSDQTANRTAIEGNLGEAYSIDLPSGVDPGFDQVDGFVETWYDQSGNGSDAVQATAAEQPKIVNAGSLVTGGLRFDDAQKLETAGTFSFGSGTTLSTFITNSSDGDEASYLFRFGSNYILLNNSAGLRRVNAGTSANAGTVSGSEELWATISTINSSGGTTNFFANGTLTSSANANIGTKTVSSQVLNIGGSSSGTHWNGTVDEVIFYDTDQTSKRVALEANIMTNYGIS